MLRNNKHDNKYLQNAWNKYREENFIFEIMEESENDEEILIKIEQKWLDETKCYEQEIGYNFCDKASSPPTMNGENNPMFGKTHTDEVKQLISLKNKGRKHSEETKKTNEPFSNGTFK